MYNNNIKYIQYYILEAEAKTHEAEAKTHEAEARFLGLEARPRGRVNITDSYPFLVPRVLNV